MNSVQIGTPSQLMQANLFSRPFISKMETFIQRPRACPSPPFEGMRWGTYDGMAWQVTYLSADPGSTLSHIPCPDQTLYRRLRDEDHQLHESAGRERED
jgi:hypothetical protein